MPLRAIRPEDYDELLAEKAESIEAMYKPFNAPSAEVVASAATAFRMRAEFRIWHGLIQAEQFCVSNSSNVHAETVCDRGGLSKRELGAASPCIEYSERRITVIEAGLDCQVGEPTFVFTRDDLNRNSRRVLDRCDSLFTVVRNA